MGFITAEEVKEKRNAVKAAFPEFKFSVTRVNHSKINVTILAGPLDLMEGVDGRYESVNYYYIKETYKDQPAKMEMLQKIYEIINAGNYTVSEDEDYGAWPSFYVSLQIGDWDRPYKIKEARPKKKAAKAVPAAQAVRAEGIELVDYSEKAFAVIGETKPVKDTLKNLGGKFNFRLKCGAGWIFSKKNEAEVREALGMA